MTVSVIVALVGLLVATSNIEHYVRTPKKKCGKFGEKCCYYINRTASREFEFFRQNTTVAVVL